MRDIKTIFSYLLRVMARYNETKSAQLLVHVTRDTHNRYNVLCEISSSRLGLSGNANFDHFGFARHFLNFGTRMRVKFNATRYWTP